ncbi:MAG: hypothetical protein MI923_00385 [Phycisphaerales bacterium]|nr:hypothetical protein [Phycisphaerales bacterium]
MLRRDAMHGRFRENENDFMLRERRLTLIFVTNLHNQTFRCLETNPFITLAYKDLSSLIIAL